jgi:hypothetical protein
MSLYSAALAGLVAMTAGAVQPVTAQEQDGPARGERAYEKAVAEASARGLPVPPRTMGMEVYSGAPVEGRQPVREIGFGK